MTNGETQQLMLACDEVHNRWECKKDGKQIREKRQKLSAKIIMSLEREGEDKSYKTLESVGVKTTEEILKFLNSSHKMEHNTNENYFIQNNNS